MPVPLLLELIIAQLALLLAVQLQPLPVLTVTVAVPLGVVEQLGDLSNHPFAGGPQLDIAVHALFSQAAGPREHEPPDQFGVLDRNAQRHVPPERVADQNRRPDESAFSEKALQRMYGAGVNVDYESLVVRLEALYLDRTADTLACGVYGPQRGGSTYQTIACVTLRSS